MILEELSLAYPSKVPLRSQHHTVLRPLEEGPLFTHHLFIQL